VKETSEAKMAEMMVGRPVNFKVEKQPKKAGDVVLKVENLSVLNNKKVLGLKNFSIEVKKGEILGIAGVEGNGQTELIEAITGMRHVKEGKIILKGEDIT
ncbi:Galactose/methyl galactoside import ATP-binding protein MglA, partial [human gut metagenome]